MGNLNKNEVGQPIRINLGEDISLSTPTLVIEPRLGIRKEITAGVSIPAVNVTLDSGQVLLANEYVEYFTKEDDLIFNGQWRFKALLNFSPTDIRQTDFQRFSVLA